jgi:hypothetical protein
MVMPKTRSDSAPKPAKAGGAQGKKAAKKAKASSSGMTNSNAPLALGTRVQSGGPKIYPGSDGKSTRIAHCELVIGQVLGSPSFTVQNFIQLNPGLADVFPWLSTQAAKWEQYKCHKLNAIWLPIASANTQGDAYISPNYNAQDPSPVTEQQCANNKDTVSERCWERFVCRLNPQSMMALGPRRFTRPCAVAGDLKTFDVGSLVVATVNQLTASPQPAVGKLWLDYDFEFFTPQNDPSPSTYPLNTAFYGYASSQSLTTGTGAYLTASAVEGDPIFFGPPVAGVFTPPAGCYLVKAFCTLNDSIAETMIGQLEILKNGAVIGPVATFRMAGVSGGTSMSLMTETIVSCNGTDTVGANVLMTGSSGTLTVTAGSSGVVASLA